MKNPILKFKVTRQETQTGHTMFMGKHTYKTKVEWYVELEDYSDYNKLDDFGKDVNLGSSWFKRKKDAVEVCELLNWFYSQDNLYEAYSHEKTKRLLKLLGNVSKKMWKGQLRAYEENKKVYKKSSNVILFMHDNGKPIFTMTIVSPSQVTDGEIIQAVKEFYSNLYDNVSDFKIDRFNNQSVIKFTIDNVEKRTLYWSFFSNMHK